MFFFGGLVFELLSSIWDWQIQQGNLFSLLVKNVILKQFKNYENQL